MSEHFNRKTFEYFEEAHRHPKALSWFEKNKAGYEENVKAPLRHLTKVLSENLAGDFPGINFDMRKCGLPVYRKNIPEDGTLIKPFAWAFFAEKRTSLFEWNPGINLYLGHEEISLGMGLYHPSSRQMAALRPEISGLDKILKAKKLKAAWGELSGERFTRFPQGFDEGARGGEYLWHKQFILTKNLPRRNVLSRNFPEMIIEYLRAGASFLEWIRETVGVYEKDRAA
jgi:uncharacterized protein (DUF2461 family)